MEITYTLTMTDIFRFNTIMLRRRPRLFWRTALSLLFVPAIWLLYWTTQPALISSPFTGLGGVILVLIIWALFLFWNTRRAIIRRNAKNIGQKVVRLYPDGFYVGTELYEIKYRWPAITEILETPHYLFFFTGPLIAYLIPREAFASQEQVQVFGDYARACRVGTASANSLASFPADTTTWPPPPQSVR